MPEAKKRILNTLLISGSSRNKKDEKLSTAILKANPKNRLLNIPDKHKNATSLIFNIHLDY